MKAKKLPGLQIDSPTVKTKGANFKPDSWPPSDDFPVVVTADGEVISRYGDVRWNLSPWAGHTSSIYFGDGPGQGKKVDPENASFLRKIVGWWIWGYGGVPSAKALVFRFESIKPLFVACSDNGVLITELSKFPKVIEDVANYYPSRGDRLISYLHILHYSRAELGFSILDDDGLKFLATVLPKHQKTQTAYIPARIWSYQVSRLRKCLEDYIKHQDKIENCFKFCLEAYAKNAGGRLSNAFGGLGLDAPFRNVSSESKESQGKVFYGSFENTAKRFEILNLLNRWVLLNDQNGVAAISSYLSLISTVGLAYVLSFSLMRVSEGAQLRTDCLEVEHDDISGEIYLLKGISSKTIVDNNAYWIVNPTIQIAIDAMKSVASLRMSAAKENPFIELSNHDVENPILQSLPHEPWSPRAPRSNLYKDYKKIRSYREIIKIWPKLFNDCELTITSEDIEIANRLTFGLNPEIYSVGKLWPLSWHQLRRTGAVNMLSSGLVSEASLQYQLKHASRAMSQYYGKNFYRLKKPLDDQARNFYLTEMYQATAREITALQSDQYISPHSEKRKVQILSEVSEKDHEQMVKAAKNGLISYRETFLGGCAKRGAPCPLGGISNISSCMGFAHQNACDSAILDKAKLPIIKNLKNILMEKSKNAPLDSALSNSLHAQLESAQRAIDAIENS